MREALHVSLADNVNIPHLGVCFFRRPVSRPVFRSSVRARRRALLQVTQMMGLFEGAEVWI